MTDGCGRTVPGTPYVVRVEIHGVVRKFRVVPPVGVDTATRVPLILGFHGSDGSAHDPVFAPSQGHPIVALYPEGQNQSWYGGAKGWDNRNNESPDVAFVGLMLDYAKSHFCIDKASVYAWGVSWGGWMANQAGCAFPEAFTAVGSIAGGGPFYPNPGNGAGCKGPLSAFIVHGKTDKVEPIAEGRKSQSAWASINRCSGATQTYVRKPCLQYACKTEARLVYCEWNGGHESPEWGTETMWTFFRESSQPSAR